MNLPTPPDAASPRAASTGPASSQALPHPFPQASPAVFPPAPQPATPAGATQAAALRLGASRLRLALALAALRTDAEAAQAGAGSWGDRFGDPPGGLDPASAGRASAGGGLFGELFDDALDAIGLRGHAPLAWLAWRVGRAMGRDRLASWSTRHPWRLVGVAAVGGALFIGLQPWRWLTRPAVLVGLLMQLAAAARARAPCPGPADPSAQTPRPWRRTTGPRPGVFR